MNFETFFSSGAGGKKPRPYQERLAEEDWPETRVIPTGFGKTAAVLAAWLWKIGKRDPGTPQRLIYCLPMRTLVEQTEIAAKEWITELAPWSSLVQRFGRCNRYGECGREGADVFWVDVPEQEEAPYTAQEFGESREKLEHLSSCGPADIATIAPSAPGRGAIIRRRDLLDLYDTDPDLSGFDVDVSLYVRDASDTDVRLFWRHVEEGKEPAFDAPAPDRAELCPAPIGGTKQLLSRVGVRAWVWNGRERRWLGVGKTGVFPGMTLWVDVASGGYEPLKGFNPAAKGIVESVPAPEGGEEPAASFYARLSTTCGTDINLEAIIRKARLGQHGP